MECPGKTLSSSPALPCFHAWTLLQMNSHWDFCGHCCLWHEKGMSGNEWAILLLGLTFCLVSVSGCTARGSLNPCGARLFQQIHGMPQQMGSCCMAHSSSWERGKNQTSVNGHHSLPSVSVVEKFKMRLSLCSCHLLAVDISLHNVYFGAASVFT